MMNTPAMMSSLPWLDPAFARLWQAHQQGRLGQAFLIVGAEGLGKRLFARRLAAALHCDAPSPDGRPCGQCIDCQFHASGGHPDWTDIQPDPEAKSPEIKVEAIRDLCSHQALTTTRRGPSVVCIAPAEAMNLFAANSLLKTLEEPAASTLLLLVSEDPSRLPATIRSRCQQIPIERPDQVQALDWLRTQWARLPDQSTAQDPTRLLMLAHGAPLRALALAQSETLTTRTRFLETLLAVAEGQQDPLECTASWKSIELPELLDWLATWIADLLRLAQVGEGARLEHPDQQAALSRLAATIDVRQGHQFLHQVMTLKAKPLTSLNRQLLSESLALDWALMTRS